MRDDQDTTLCAKGASTESTGFGGRGFCRNFREKWDLPAVEGCANVQAMTDLVPQAVRDLLAFYTERYPEVRFGDLDIGVLKRAVESIDEVAKEVLAAEEAVAQARVGFRAIEGELSLKAGRTLSFLKIFVDGDPEQLAVLDAIQMALPASRRKAKASAEVAGEPKQRRTRKSKTVESPAEVSADAAIEAALEKAGLTDDELSELSSDGAEPEVESDVEVAPAAKKSGSKSAAE